MKTLKERFEEKFIEEPNSGCWLWTAMINEKGYGHFQINKKPEKAHRVSYQLYCEEIPDNTCILHKCDVRCCVNPDHLTLGTQHDNINDMLTKGRQQKGERNGSNKLTEEQVLCIFNDDRKLRVIAREYEVDHKTISAIKKGKTWNWLTKSS